MILDASRSVILVCLLALSLVSWASPDSDSLRTTAEQIVQQLQNSLDEAKAKDKLTDNVYIDELVRTDILPHVATEELTKRIFKRHWSSVKESKQEAKALSGIILSLTRTYRIAFGAYNGQELVIDKIKKKKKVSIVRVLIGGLNGKRHAIDFAFKRINETWKVFDFSVNGIVMSKTLSQSIDYKITQTSLDEAIADLNKS